MSERLRRWWVRWSDYFDTKWSGLLLISIFTLTKGTFYLPYALGYEPLYAVERWGTPEVWAGVWMGVGCLGLVCAVSRSWGHGAVGVIFALYFLWSCMYFGSWMWGYTERGYVTGHGYLLIALLVMWSFSRPRVALVRVGSEVEARDAPEGVVDDVE